MSDGRNEHRTKGYLDVDIRVEGAGLQPPVLWSLWGRTRWWQIRSRVDLVLAGDQVLLGIHCEVGSRTIGSQWVLWWQENPFIPSLLQPKSTHEAAETTRMYSFLAPRRASTGLVSPETSLLGLWMAVLPLDLHMVFPLCDHAEMSFLTDTIFG